MAAVQAPPLKPQGPQGAQGAPEQPKPERRVGKFRVRSGDHVDDQLRWLPLAKVQEYARQAGIDPSLSDAPSGKGLSPLRAAVRSSRVAERHWKAGTVVASPRPLSSRWPDKFERVDDSVPESPGEHTLRPSEQDIEEEWTDGGAQRQWEAQATDDLHRLDVGKLRELAYEEGIELGGAADKASILATIRRRRRAIAEDR